MEFAVSSFVLFLSNQEIILYNYFWTNVPNIIRKLFFLNLLLKTIYNLRIILTTSVTIHDTKQQKLSELRVLYWMKTG